VKRGDEGFEFRLADVLQFVDEDGECRAGLLRSLYIV